MAHSSQSKVVTFAVLALIAIVALYSCWPRPDPAVVIPDQASVAPLQEAHEQAKQGFPVNERVEVTAPKPEAAAPAAQTATPKPSAKAAGPGRAPVARRGGLSATENRDADEGEAWVKGWLSAARAQCLRTIVDRKAEVDASVGRIQDWGNARAAAICQDQGVLIAIAGEMLNEGRLIRPGPKDSDRIAKAVAKRQARGGKVGR